jgi:hypothetical protein
MQKGGTLSVDFCRKGTTFFRNLQKVYPSPLFRKKSADFFISAKFYRFCRKCAPFCRNLQISAERNLQKGAHFL